MARLGGDEFALLLEDTDNPAVAAHRVQQELQAPFEVAGQQLLVTASLGIAISSTGFSRPVDVLRDADAAMYRAKARGRARVEIADAELHAHSLSQLELESQLRDAMENGEIRLHFQPIVVMESRELVGFEALLRWQHPGRGLIGPEEGTTSGRGIRRWPTCTGCRWTRSRLTRSFVHQLHTDPALQAVIQTVISLSGSLRLDTVAEEVETDEDARALHRMGCRLGQGFLFSRPLPPNDTGRILAALPAVLAAR